MEPAALIENVEDSAKPVSPKMGWMGVCGTA